MRSCRSRCARVFTYIYVSTNGDLASFYGETMEEMWWGGGGERPVWRRSKCGEKQVVVGICRLPKSEKAGTDTRGASYTRCALYTSSIQGACYIGCASSIWRCHPRAHLSYSRRTHPICASTIENYTRRIFQYAPPVLGHLPPPGPPNLFEAHPIHMRLK